MKETNLFKDVKYLLTDFWMRMIMSPMLLLGEVAVNIFLCLHAYLGLWQHTSEHDISEMDL